MNISKVLGLGLINSSSIICLFCLMGCRVVNWQYYEAERIYVSGKNSIKLTGYYRSDKAFCFMYEDGSSLHAVGFDSAEQFFRHAKKWSYYDELKNYVRTGGGWGGFYTNEENEIIIQTLSSLSSGGFPPLIGVVERKGKLLNDSTFAITQENVPQSKEFINLGTPQIYRFISYTPKPDSSNWVRKRIVKKRGLK